MASVTLWRIATPTVAIDGVIRSFANVATTDLFTDVDVTDYHSGTRRDRTDAAHATQADPTVEPACVACHCLRRRYGSGDELDR